MARKEGEERRGFPRLHSRNHRVTRREGLICVGGLIYEASGVLTPLRIT